MAFDPDWLLWLLAGALIIIGMAGLALPALPGAPLLFVGLVVAAWADDFAYIGTGTIVTLAVLAILTYAVDIIAGALGARRFGASPRAITGATVGAIVGLFFGLVGIVLGPFVGALVGELSQRRNLRTAGLSGIGATVGLIAGAVGKLVLAFTMLGLFVFMRWF